MTARRIRRTGVAIAATLLLTGCRGAPQVRWITYDPSLQTRIDVASVQHDCDELRTLRRLAELTSEQHEKASGYPNDALIQYIEGAEQRASCPTSSSALGPTSTRSGSRGGTA